MFSQHEVDRIGDIIGLAENRFLNVDTLETALDNLKDRVNAKLQDLKTDTLIRNRLDNEHNIKSKNAFPENIYLFVRGKTLKNEVIIPLLKSLAEKVRLSEFEKFKSLPKEGIRNQITTYENRFRKIDDVFEEHTDYYSCPLMSKVATDIQQFISFENKNTTKPKKQ